MIPVLLFLASATPLSMAYISQYFFGLHPCELCLYQRIPYAVNIVLSLLILFIPSVIPYFVSIIAEIVKKLTPDTFYLSAVEWLLVLCGISFLCGGVMAFFHTGVEYKWWEGLSGCTSVDLGTTIEEIRAAIMVAPLVRCDEPAFIFLGLSMAGWNVVYSAVTSFICFYVLYILRRSHVRG